MIRKTLIAGLSALTMTLAFTAEGADAIRWNGDAAAPGVYFDRYEPSFYAGFAPRTQDPGRVHLELSRGNQLRLTLVLGPNEIDRYLVNLLMRRSVVQALVDADVIELTTNLAFERYSAAINDALIEDVVLRQGDLGASAYREQSIAVMERLNPGRVFRIALPFERLAADWHRTLKSIAPTGPDRELVRLDAANAILPERVDLYALTDTLGTALDGALRLVRAGKSPNDPGFRSAAADFLAQATDRHYPIVDGRVSAVEFTAVYPAGTARSWTTDRMAQLPDLGPAGVWPLLRRDQGRGITGVVDYLSPSPGYGYLPVLAFAPAADAPGYNALHNPGIRARLDDTPFLPAEWTKVAGERHPNKRYRNLWIGSRGPSSGGSTRLPSGHISELRELLPSSSMALENVTIYRNLPQCHDVFDIDGDGRAEVIGLTYFLAYRAQGHRPRAAYAPNDREGFYAWLYQRNIADRPDGDGSIINEVPVCRFVGLHSAAERDLLHRIPLHEAPYAPEAIQFYRTKTVGFESSASIELNRELRRIGADYEVRYEALMLE